MRPIPHSSFCSELTPCHSDDLPGDQRAPHNLGDSTAVDLPVLEKLGLLTKSAVGMDVVEAVCVGAPRLLVEAK